MSAIEMMDPKMDAGMMCNQIKRKVLSFEQAVEVICFAPIIRNKSAMMIDYFLFSQKVGLGISCKLSLNPL